MTFATLVGDEIVLVQGIAENGIPSSFLEPTTTQAIASLGGGGGGVGRTVVAAGTYPMTNADRIVNINKTSPAITAVIGPPSPTAWVVYTVKDAAGNASTYPITITPTSGTIDGGANYTIVNDFDAVDFYTDGTNTFTK